MLQKLSKYGALVIMVLLLLSGLSSCASSPPQEKYYYTLQYDPSSEQAELIQSEPIDASVWVQPASISRTYKRNQIVKRHFGPRISYLENHLWANDLEEKISELISARLQAYDLFKIIRLDFPYSRPDYELIPTVTTIEFLHGDGNSTALLNMRFDLRTLDGNSLVTTEIERRISVYDSRLDSFVQVMNEAILAYTDQFAAEVAEHFNRSAGSSGPSGIRENQLQNLEEQDTDHGQLLLPGVFSDREQPLYRIIGKGREPEWGRFGTPVELEPGRYTIRYGSGNSQLKLQRSVEIRPGYRTIVEPDYGGLQVEIITPDGRPVELSYQVFDAETGNSYGSDYSTEGMGELEGNFWILPTGRYKVTLNNEPFATNRDFAAAYVEQGKGDILTISVEKIEGSERYQVVGGGVIKEPLYLDEQQHWVLASSIAGNVSGFLNNNDSFESYSSGFNFNGFLQNRLRYDYGRFNLSVHNLTELGASRSELGTFEVTRDSIELDTTLVMDLLLTFGLYVNLDIRSHLFPAHYRESTPFSYEKRDSQGDLLTGGGGVDSVKLAGPFIPIDFQEGGGLNINLVEEPWVESSLRFGIGLRQNLYGDSFEVLDEDSDPIVFQQQENVFSTGLEAALQFSTQSLNNLSYSSRFDAYAPFEDLTELELTWIHDLQLSLLRNVSLDYRATLYNAQSSAGGDYFASDHGLYLRFSTIYRMSF
ncbi:MAG: ABC-type transport auxiliary lipoprotein family protein [Spirochaetia bacterium]